jgi:hypothetical protein
MKIIKKTFRYFLLAALLSPLLMCQINKSNLNVETGKIFATVSKDPNSMYVLMGLFNNSTSNYYVPLKPWVSVSGDTLFLEAIYKRRNIHDVVISYNAFIPPKLEELEVGSAITKRINYIDSLLSKVVFFSIRIYKKPYPYNPIKNYGEYYSIESFLEYENANSFLLIGKIVN